MSKGSKRRPTNSQKYADNYDRIFNPVKDMDKLHCPYCEVLLEHQAADPEVKRFFDGLFCPEPNCNYDIPSFDYPLYGK